MLDLPTYLEHLVRATENVAQGEERVVRQVARLESLRAAGRDTHHAEAHLRGLEQNLEAWRQSLTQIHWAIALSRESSLPRPLILGPPVR